MTHPCPDCQGTGRLAGNGKCPRCLGTGSVVIHRPYPFLHATKARLLRLVALIIGKE